MMKGGVILLFGFVVLQLAYLSAKSEIAPIISPSPSPAAGELVHVPRNYIVYMSEPLPITIATGIGESPKERSLRILSWVFPSKKAAEDALIYAFRVIPGFAATMTSHQAILLNEQAEVFNVVRVSKYHLDLGTGKGRHGGISTQHELGE